jgi:hypothetical protein
MIRTLATLVAILALAACDSSSSSDSDAGEPSALTPASAAIEDIDNACGSFIDAFMTLDCRGSGFESDACIAVGTDMWMCMRDASEPYALGPWDQTIVDQAALDCRQDEDSDSCERNLLAAEAQGCDQDTRMQCVTVSIAPDGSVVEAYPGACSELQTCIEARS